MELTLDLSAFTSAQRYELLALIESFATPRFIPSADENAEHAAPSGRGSIRKIPDSPTTRHAFATYPELQDY